MNGNRIEKERYAYCILTHTHSSNNMRLDGVAYL